MNSRETLINSLSYQEGRIPVDLGGTAVTGMHCETVAALRAILGLEDRPVKIVDPYQMLGEIDEELIEALGVDTLPLWDERSLVGIRMKDYKEWTTPWGQDVMVPGEFNVTKSEQGDVFLYPQGDLQAKPSLHMPASGRFFDAVDRQMPYDEENLRLEDNTEEFCLVDANTLTALGEKAAQRSKSGKGIVGSFGGAAFGDIALVPAVGLKEPKGVRGVADWYMLLASDPDFVKRIFDAQLEIVLENLKRIAQVVGDVPQVLYTCGTDFGTQIGTFCSLDTFRNLYKPYYKKVNHWIHQNTAWKTFKHSCGSVELFVEDMIDAGFDILNPIQWMAANMDRRELKRKYKSRITFWGGGINTQQTLPFGTPDEVYREAKECCEIFGEGGGFVFSAIHNIQARVPAENVLALFQAVRDHNANFSG